MYNLRDDGGAACGSAKSGFLISEIGKKKMDRKRNEGQRLTQTITLSLHDSKSIYCSTNDTTTDANTVTTIFMLFYGIIFGLLGCEYGKNEVFSILNNSFDVQNNAFGNAFTLQFDKNFDYFGDLFNSASTAAPHPTQHSTHITLYPAPYPTSISCEFYVKRSENNVLLNEYEFEYEKNFEFEFEKGGFGMCGVLTDTPTAVVTVAPIEFEFKVVSTPHATDIGFDCAGASYQVSHPTSYPTHPTPPPLTTALRAITHPISQTLSLPTLHQSPKIVNQIVNFTHIWFTKFCNVTQNFSLHLC